MSDERWMPVDGWPYEISDHGRLRSLDRTVLRSDNRRRRFKGKIISPGVMPTGHLTVTLSRSGERKTTQIHRLVMAAFVGSRPEGMEVRHLDGNPANNVLPNLRYGTRSENKYDRVRHGVDHNARKTFCKWGHEFTPENTILRSGSEHGRRCKTCKSDEQRRRRARRGYKK